MDFKLDQRNLKITAVLALAAFLLTQDLRTTLILAAVNIGAGFLL